MAERSPVYEALLQIVNGYPGVRMGIADISYSKYSDQFNRALVFAVPHTKKLSLTNYSEADFEDVICEAKNTINRLVPEVTAFLDAYGIAYFVPPIAQRDEKDLVAPFSFKFAAIHAGMGWIGKNGVLVTKEYGPRVRLSAVLIQYPLPAGEPIRKSMCDENCFLCVKACPYNALKGISWNIHTHREELIDYHLCNSKRSQFIGRLGRKNACGLCFVACPLGMQDPTSPDDC